MGQEVIVHFMAGDPDQPIVTGRVYNENHKVPYELPANQTQSGIKSRSTMGGSAENFNEIRFEDKKGKEIVTIHAERNLSTTVEADETLSVGNDRTKTVGHDEKAEVKNEQHQGISQSQFLMVGAAKHEKVAAESACNVGGQLSLTVAGDVVEVFESAHSEDVTGTYFLKATGDLVIESVASVTLKCGPSTIVLDPSGVSVEAAKITLNASGMTMINSGPGSPPKDGTAGTATEPTEPTLGGANEG
jgi:type VI secretion system secreted protein VgrG